MRIRALIMKAEESIWGGHDVYLGDQKIGHREGRYPDDAIDEAEKSLADLLRERLGWKKDRDEDI